MPDDDPYLMYMILRRDLIDVLKWPLGACMTQVAHAATAALWKHRDAEDTVAYMQEVERMRKVTLQVANEAELKKVSEKLQTNNIAHHMWQEQPENTSTCIATAPQRKSIVQPLLRHLKLFK